MSIAISVDNIATELGDSQFVHAFFSTIAVRLEGEQWGSRFPALMNELYQGRLEGERASTALQELRQIRQELKAFAPSEIVWDIDEPQASPPWGADISEDITDLSNYFVTSTGRDMFDAMEDPLGEAALETLVVEIISI